MAIESAVSRNSKDMFKHLRNAMKKEMKGGATYEDNRFWSPEIDKSGSGFAVIRFLSKYTNEEIEEDVNDQKFPYVKIYKHAFNNAGRWFIENCPSTIGRPCPVCNANTVLWRSGQDGNNEDLETVRKRKRQLKFVSNIMVLSDPKRPQFEGKVFLFNYGTKIFHKLMGALDPEFEDEKDFNPFCHTTGAPFKLKIRNYEGYRNYDKSEFGPCAPLFETKEELDKVRSMCYDLMELIDPVQIKSYDELNQKFLMVTSITNNNFNASGEVIKPATQPAQTNGTKAASKMKSDVNNHDDDYQMFSKLLEE